MRRNEGEARAPTGVSLRLPQLQRCSLSCGKLQKYQDAGCWWIFFLVWSVVTQYHGVQVLDGGAADDDGGVTMDLLEEMLRDPAMQV